ncbi:MAG: caspase family protein [Cyanobacteria bacterium P01_F01_bin.150]
MTQGMSLHIGLNSVDPNHYGNWSGPLNACEADAEDMQAIANDKGFQSTILKTTQATRKAVTDAIQNAAKKLVSGDIFMVSYSGHGGQVPDSNGDEKDRLDETWCLYDGQLIDDELKALYAEFTSGVRILVFSDSCHSGTVTRADRKSFIPPSEIPTRNMPNAAALRTYRMNRAFYNEIGKNVKKLESADAIKATILLISGCQDNQLSYDGTFNGRFTGTLLSIWNNGSFKGNYEHFKNDTPIPLYD